LVKTSEAIYFHSFTTSYMKLVSYSYFIWKKLTKKGMMDLL